MILPSRSFLLWSVFFFPLFPPDAMPEHSELIDGDPGLGVYWESKNSFIRNYARLYWRAGAVRVSCPVQLGGRASGMKPTSFKKSSKNGTGRSIGQAVACLVMAAAITIGGAGTTFLLASQPAGLTVEPAALQTEGRVTLPKFDHKSDRSEINARAPVPVAPMPKSINHSHRLVLSPVFGELLTGFPPSGVFSAGFSSSTMVTCCTSSVSFTSNSTSFATR